MKKLLGIMLASGMILSTAVAAMAAPTVKIGGEGNFGYDFAKKDGYEDKGGANFGDYAVTATSDITENITLFGKWKSGDLSQGEFKSDEVYAYLKFAPMNVKIGYYGFGFGGSKDILDVPQGDFKSKVGIQVDTLIADVVAVKLYVPTTGEYKTKSSVAIDDTGHAYTKTENDYSDFEGCGDDAYATRIDFNKDKFGAGLIYGKTDLDFENKGADVDGTTMTLTAYFKPIKDLKAYVDHSQRTVDFGTSKTKDTDIIIGALYTPASMPIEARFEYDLNDKGNNKESGYNPWGLRFGYKLTPNAKIEMNRNSKAYGSKEASIKLNLTF